MAQARKAQDKGKRVLIVEDVITSGGQVVLSTADLRGIGAQITDVVCVIDRSEGGTEALGATLGRETDLWRTYKLVAKPGAPIAMRKVRTRREIFPVFRDLFSRENATA